jgi:hypothetical protein
MIRELEIINRIITFFAEEISAEERIRLVNLTDDYYRAVPRDQKGWDVESQAMLRVEALLAKTE